MLDPLTAILIAMYIAGKFTKNVTQDMAWKARGEDPPSYRRERERWERRQAKRAAGNGPGRKLLANAWADACAAGDERRARIAERATERRHAKWADAAEAEAREINDRIGQAPTETVYTCGGCGREIGQSEVAGFALSGDALCRGCRTGNGEGDRSTKKTRPAETDRHGGPEPEAPDGTPNAHENPQEEQLRKYRLDEWAFAPDGPVDDTSPTNTPHHCERCGRAAPMSSLVPRGTSVARGGEDEFRLLCTSCVEHVDRQVNERVEETRQRLRDAVQGQTPRREDGPPPRPGNGPTGEDPNPSRTNATVTDLAEWRAKGATPPITKEDIVSGETTNLSAALAYTQDMANQCGSGAASTETSIATLQNANVSGPVLGHLANAQDLLAQAMAAFNAAHAELQADAVVKDAYQARQGAGDKEFATQE